MDSTISEPLAPDWEWTDEAGIAQWVDVPRESVRVWRYRGGGPKWHRIGKHVRYRRADVETWLAERTRAAPSEQVDG